MQSYFICNVKKGFFLAPIVFFSGRIGSKLLFEWERLPTLALATVVNCDPLCPLWTSLVGGSRRTWTEQPMAQEQCAKSTQNSNQETGIEPMSYFPSQNQLHYEHVHDNIYTSKTLLCCSTVCLCGCVEFFSDDSMRSPASYFAGQAALTDGPLNL